MGVAGLQKLIYILMLMQQVDLVSGIKISKKKFSSQIIIQSFVCEHCMVNIIHSSEIYKKKNSTIILDNVFCCIVRNTAVKNT